MRAAVAELASWGAAAGMPRRLALLRDHREALAPLAEAAVQGGLGPAQRAAVVAAVEALEAALRARLAADAGP